MLNKETLAYTEHTLGAFAALFVSQMYRLAEAEPKLLGPVFLLMSIGWCFYNLANIPKNPQRFFTNAEYKNFSRANSLWLCNLVILGVAFLIVCDNLNLLSEINSWTITK